jgi:DNA primase large subunit
MEEYKLMTDDYAKYPFLESFSKVAGAITFMQLPLPRLLETIDGKRALDIAKNRVITALTSEEKDVILDKDVQIKMTNKISNIIAFGLARMIVSCTTQYVIDKFANKEAERAIYLLNHDREYIRQAVFRELNYNKDSVKIPLSDYISLNMMRYGKEYKLVNCDITRGNVVIQNSNLILKEKIKKKITRKLPLNVNPDAKEIFKPVVSEIMQHTSSTFSNDLGDVTIEHFPPCINNIINMIKKEENPTHFGRFALVSFCNKIGMSDTEIVSLFQTVKDFEVSTSLYQVEHITGKRGGTVYAAPACAALKTNNLCRSGTDPLCNRVKHPLGYYSSMQKRKQKPQKPL